MQKLWADLAMARRKLIESHALDNDLLLTRLWYHHLFWFWSFVRTETIIEARALAWAAYRGYCRLADRLLGGSRGKKFRELLQKRAERYEAKAREIQAAQEARRWRHEQFTAAVDQRKKELEEEMRALMHGNFVTRDPKTYN